MINNISFAVIIPTYFRQNGKTLNYLKRSINSVINQIYTDWVLIIVGDNYEVQHEPEMLKLIDEFKISNKDKNIIYLKNDLPERDFIKNKKILWRCAGANALNIGLKYARENGFKYYAHLDDDDYWSTDHLYEHYQVYSKYPSCIFVNTKSSYLNSYIPIKNINIFENNLLPTPNGMIHSSISFRCDILLFTYFSSFIESEIKEPSDAKMWKDIREFILNNTNYTSIYNSKLTCFHDLERESLV